MHGNINLPTNGTDTSALAAHAARGKAASDRALVYAKISENGLLGATCSELERWLGLRHEACSARVWELAGGNDPDKYPILIAYLGEKRPALDADGEPKRTKSRVYVAIKNLPEHIQADIRAEARARLTKELPAPA